MLRNWSKVFRQGNAVYQLNVLGNAAIAAFERRAIELVGFDVRTTRILRLIGDNPGVTFAELTVMTALERSLTSRLIQELVRKGLVERRNYATDARRFGLHITEAGEAVRARADEIGEQAIELVFQKLTPSQMAAFSGAMEALADWIDSDEFEAQVDQMFEGLERKRDSASA